MACSSCNVDLQVEDGHDVCPSCIGVAHLKEALINPCMNCAILPLSVREKRLRDVENLLAGEGHSERLPPSGVVSGGKEKKRKRAFRDERGRSGQKRPALQRHELDELRAEVERLRAIVQQELPPPQEDLGLGEDNADVDAMSTRASDSMFHDGAYSPRDDPSEQGSRGETEPASVQAEDGSETSRLSSGSAEAGEGPCALQAMLRAALAKAGMDEAAAHVVSNPFLKRRVTVPPFAVPPSPHYLSQLRQCWTNPDAPVRRDKDARTLASMKDADKNGLDHMPGVDQCIRAMVLSPDEALKRDARCPSAQCRVTDSLLSKAYDSAACMARMGNSLSVLLLAQSKMLESEPGGELSSVNDVALETFALMSRELGRVMSTLVVARRQVWLAQAPKLSDHCRKVLRQLPVVPGQLFGPEADKLLEDRQQSQQASEAFGQRGRGMVPHSARFAKPRGARDPRRSAYLDPQPQPWSRDQGAVGRWLHQPRGGQRQPRQPHRGRWPNQRPPKPPNNPSGTA